MKSALGPYRKHCVPKRYRELRVVLGAPRQRRRLPDCVRALDVVGVCANGPSTHAHTQTHTNTHRKQFNRPSHGKCHGQYQVAHGCHVACTTATSDALCNWTMFSSVEW